VAFVHNGGLHGLSAALNPPTYPQRYKSFQLTTKNFKERCPCR